MAIHRNLETLDQAVSQPTSIELRPGWRRPPETAGQLLRRLAIDAGAFVVSAMLMAPLAIHLWRFVVG